MRLCFKQDCENLTWVSDHYEGKKDHETDISWRYWVTSWTSDEVVFTGKTARGKGGDGTFPLEATFTGNIAPGGGKIVAGKADWKIGYSQSGNAPYTLAWGKSGVKSAEVSEPPSFLPPRHSVKHPNIILRADAVEGFAEHPPVIRPMLQPEYSLARGRAKLPCESALKVSDVEALEIGRAAYRAGDMTRGYCWLKRSVGMGNIRALAVAGIMRVQGLGVPRDIDMAFALFKKGGETKDVWSLWGLKQCYSLGAGTTKDASLAASIDLYLMRRDDGRAVFTAINGDDEEQLREYQKGLQLINPPMKSHEVCNYNLKNQNPCHIVTEPQ